MPKPNKGWHLWLDPATTIWHLRLFTAGRPITRSTGSRDRGVAEEVLARWLLQQRYPQAAENPTVAVVLDLWLNHKQRIGQKSVSYKVKALTRHLGWLRVSDYRAAHTRSYIAARRAEQRADGTIREELSKLSSAFHWAASEQIIPAAPIIKANLQVKARSRWLTRDEADRLLASCIAPHVRLFVMLGLHTGARPGAILELTWDQVDFERRLIDYGEVLGGKPRAVVPINDDLLPALIEAREAATTDRVIEYAGRGISRIRDTIAATAARAELPPLTPHDLRRTAGHWLMQAGSSIEEVAAVLGHRDTATTHRVYARLYPEHLRAAVKRLEKA